MHHPMRRLREWVRLVTEDGFAASILAVVTVAAVIAFGFGATEELVGVVIVAAIWQAAGLAIARLHMLMRNMDLER